jgi:hypothetical protein
MRGMRESLARQAVGILCWLADRPPFEKKALPALGGLIPIRNI